nr:hypothetical 21K protein - Paramecium aurelia sp. 4,51 mitochondrion [Paramecium aurelia]
IRRAFIELDRVKGCFFRRGKRKAKKLNSSGAFAFGSSYAGTYLLDKHSRRKNNLYLRSFFFFKFYYCNLFNFNPGFIGAFYHTRPGVFFLDHFFFFNNFLEIPSFFENAAEAEPAQLMGHLVQDCAAQTTGRGLVNFERGLVDSKPKFLDAFFGLLSLKRTTNRFGILFFLIFCLRRA